MEDTKTWRFKRIGTGNKDTGIHITHNDADGVGCAVVTNLMFPTVKWENHFVAIGKQDDLLLKTIHEIIETKEVPMYIFVTDLSVEENTLTKVKDLLSLLHREYSPAPIFQLIDHHGTNRLHMIPGYDNLVTVQSGKIVPDWIGQYSNVAYIDDIYDDELGKFNNFTYSVKLLKDRLGLPEQPQVVSATYLTYEYILNISGWVNNPEKTKLSPFLPIFIREISRYDTWVWKNLDLHNKFFYESDGISEDRWTYMTKTFGPDSAFAHFMTIFTGDMGARSKEYDLVLDITKTMQEKEKKVTASVIFRTRFAITCSSYITAIFIGDDEHGNMSAEHLKSFYPWIDLVMVLHPRTNTVSLYSCKPYINCGLLAKAWAERYGAASGGGHPGAAGLKYNAGVNNDRYLMHFLLRYYTHDFYEQEERFNLPGSMSYQALAEAAAIHFVEEHPEDSEPITAGEAFGLISEDGRAWVYTYLDQHTSDDDKPRPIVWG